MLAITIALAIAARYYQCAIMALRGVLGPSDYVPFLQARLMSALTTVQLHTTVQPPLNVCALSILISIVFGGFHSTICNQQAPWRRGFEGNHTSICFIAFIAELSQ